MKKKFPNAKMGLVIAMSSFRKTIKNVFRNIEGLNQDMVIGPSDLAKSKYDILFIDEAHRLRKRVNLTNYASFDNTARALGLKPQETNELEWTQMRSEKNLYFYDPKQSIKPTDVNPEDFNKLKSNSNSKVVQLYSQFRSLGGNGYVQFVNGLLDQNFQQVNSRYSDKKYEVLLFENFPQFVSELKLKNTKHQLCRFVAGYGWKWISKKDKSKYDIVINGLRFQWNHDNIEFILKDDEANQIGCIHTTQGYDLNYVGVIFGPEIILNPKTKKIEILQENYHDKNGQNTVSNIEVLKQYIINIYKTIMLRGILGCYIYVCDEHLRNYFKNHINIFIAKNALDTILKKTKLPDLVPFENSVPLYSLKVAAGEFYINESLPDKEFARVPVGFNVTKDHFACRVDGNSMNKIVKAGEIALFKKFTGGNMNGLMVIAEYCNLLDFDFGSCYTFKEYCSQKEVTEDGCKHEKIILKPKSTNPMYSPIIIESAANGDKKFNIIGIFEGVLE